MNIDTLSIARDLRTAELSSVQAEAIAAAIGRSVTEGVATRSDIDTLVHRMEAMEERLTAKLEASKTQILIWLMGVIVAAAGAIIAVVKL